MVHARSDIANRHIDLHLTRFLEYQRQLEALTFLQRRFKAHQHDMHAVRRQFDAGARRQVDRRHRLHTGNPIFFNGLVQADVIRRWRIDSNQSVGRCAMVHDGQVNRP